MNVVIDTNVFVSSFFGGKPRKIIDLWRKGKIVLCLSEDILEEYVDVLKRMGLKNESELDELLALFAKGWNILFTRKTPKLHVVQKDPEDDKFLECALALGARIIVTGDKELKALREYKKIIITTPDQFLHMYENTL